MNYSKTHSQSEEFTQALLLTNISLFLTVMIMFMTSRRTGAKLPTPSELLIECPSVLPPCPFIRCLHHHVINCVCCHHHHHSQYRSQHQHKILSLKKALTGTEYRTANGFSRRYERQHRHGLQGEEGEHTMMILVLILMRMIIIISMTMFEKCKSQPSRLPVHSPAE